jgi:hypothetical protein
MRRPAIVLSILLVTSAAHAKGKNQTFPQDRETVWVAAIGVAAEIGTITAAGKETGLIVYKVGGFTSGGRTDVSVSLLADRTGTKVLVGATHGYQGVFGIGKSGKVEEQFLQALAARLANTTGSAVDVAGPGKKAISAPTVTATPLSTAPASVTSEDHGLFRIESAPLGAEVYVDGDFVGTTPIAELSLTVGKHDVELRKKGFTPWKRPLSVSAGARATVAAELEP